MQSDFSARERDPAHSTRTDVQETETWNVLCGTFSDATGGNLGLYDPSLNETEGSEGTDL